MNTTELPQDTQGPAVAGPVQRTVRQDLVPLDAMLESDWADPVRRLALRKALLDENKRLRDEWEAAEAQTLRAMGDLRRLRDEIERLRGQLSMGSQARPTLDRCPYCHAAAPGWTNKDLWRGWRNDAGVRHYHCREAAAAD